MGTTGAGAGQQVVRSFARGLAVLRAFHGRPRLRAGEVAAAAGVSPAVARRTLATLVALGYAREDGDGFTLRPRVLELGWTAVSPAGLADVVLPHLARLAGRVGEWAAVTVLDGTRTAFVATAPGRRVLRPLSPPGKRTPAHPTSMGQVLLAALPDDRLEGYLAGTAREAFTERTLTGHAELAARLAAVRAQGHAVVDQEFEAGLCDLAVPLQRTDGSTLAALNVSVQSSRVSQELVDELLGALGETAAALREDLTWLPRSPARRCPVDRPDLPAGLAGHPCTCAVTGRTVAVSGRPAPAGGRKTACPTPTPPS